MSGASYSAREIRSARQKLMETGFSDDGLRPGSLGVPLSIERSWRRSLLEGTGQRESALPLFRPPADETNPLIRAANEVLDRWSDFFTDMRIAMFVSDRSGRIVARRVGEPSHARRLDKASAAEGFDFSEQSLGTNGLGTAIAERTAVLVRGAEHVNDSLQSLVCAGSPIEDLLSGRVIGSIALAAPISMSNPTMLAISRQTARQIQEAIFDLDTPSELRSILSQFTSGTGGLPMLALSKSGVISTTNAMPWFTASSQVILWDELQSRTWSGDQQDVSIEGRPARARRLLNRAGESIYIIELMHDAFAEQTGSFVTSPPACDTLLEALDTAAKQSRVIAIDGLPASGKLHLAQQWLELRGAVHPSVMDSVELRAPAQRQQLIEQLTLGDSVVIRHLERLTDEDSAWLSELLPTTDATEQSTIVLTLTSPGIALPVRSLLTEFAATVDMPPLAEDPKRVISIAEQIAAEHSVRLAPEFIQALVRWDWPGDVGELVELVEDLIAKNPRQALTAESLPFEMRVTTRKLSGLAASEYQAIEAALREAKGNRSHAADILGIGRTTLYRKMRSYGLDGSGYLTE